MYEKQTKERIIIVSTKIKCYALVNYFFHLIKNIKNTIILLYLVFQAHYTNELHLQKDSYSHYEIIGMLCLSRSP